MTGKRKKKIMSEEVVKKTTVPEIVQEKTDAAGLTLEGDVEIKQYDNKLDTLGESVAEIFSRVTKLEEMFEVLTSSAPVETEPDVEVDTKDYVVQEGETMSVISKKIYGNAGLFNRIAAHNYTRYPELRNNANDVQEGWKLRIPPAP